MEKVKELKPKNGKLPGWAIAIIIIASFLVMAFYVAFFAFFIWAAVTEENTTNSTIYDTVDDYGKRNVTSKFKTNVTKASYEPVTKTYIIEGTVYNKSSKDYDFVDMEFSLYSKGVKVGTATAIVGDVDRKESERFFAISKSNITSDIDDYKLLKITAEPEKEIVD